MQQVFSPVAPGSARLLPGELLQRYELNRRYLLSLRTENLLQNHYLEAGLWDPRHRSPTSTGAGSRPPARCAALPRPLALGRGAATAPTRRRRAQGQGDRIVAELARCQEENGGEWAGSIPEKYLDWIARGKTVWAPHYVSTRR